MTITDVFSIFVCYHPMCKTTRTRYHEIVSSEIYFFHRSGHEWKREAWFSCERKKYLSRGITPDSIFWENTSYFFFVIHECKNICFWIHFYEFEKDSLCASELDKHFVHDGYFHGHSIENFFIFSCINLTYRFFGYITTNIFYFFTLIFDGPEHPNRLLRSNNHPRKYS